MASLTCGILGLMYTAICTGGFFVHDSSTWEWVQFTTMLFKLQILLSTNTNPMPHFVIFGLSIISFFSMRQQCTPPPPIHHKPAIQHRTSLLAFHHCNILPILSGLMWIAVIINFQTSLTDENYPDLGFVREALILSALPIVVRLLVQFSLSQADDALNDIQPLRRAMYRHKHV